MAIGDRINDRGVIDPVLRQGVPGPAGTSAYASYVATTSDDPVLTEDQWVSRLGTSNPQIVAVAPPLPPDYPMPYEGLEWFDPSDGSTSVWMWKVEGVTAAVNDGFFLSQFPTPPASGIPDNSYVDEAGNAYVDNSGTYYIFD